MKILILSFYSGLVDRGVETWAENLRSKIDNQFDIRILGGDEYGNDINWKNKNSIYWKSFLIRHFFKNLKSFAKADIVIPTNGTVQSFLCRLLTLLLGKPMIVFGHSGMGADDKWNLLSSPNIFVAFSDEQKKWALKYKLPWTKVIVINHAVDTEKFKPAKSRPRKKTILCVAANTPDKRVHLVEKAVLLLDSFKFKAVGKGRKIDAKFEDMPEIYKEADVFCFVPRSHEAFGLVFLEAMASNLPIVTVDDPIRREIVGDAGIYVKNPDHSSDLANALKEAYTKNWGDKPRKQAMKFSWNKIVKDYKNLFENIK